MRLTEARVAWVVPVLGVDGNLLYNKPLLEALAPRCRSFKVFTAEFKGDDDALGFSIERCGRFWRIYKNERIASYGVGGYRSGASLITPSVIASLIKFRPDLLVVNEFSLFSLYALIARMFLGKVPVLLLVETRPRFGSSGWLQCLRQTIRRTLVRRADRILTNNQDGREYLKSELVVAITKIIEKPYLVSDMAKMAGLENRDLLEYRLSRGTNSPVRFLYVGRLIQQKGVQFALDAFARLLPSRAGKFVFDIVGDGPNRNELERQVHALGLSDHIVFHGKQPFGRLWEWYKRGDIIVFPTLADYRALVPFEALSMGLPIVASIHDGGVSETVDPGRNGYSFNPENVKDLALALSRFIDDPLLITEFAARSLEMASQYTLERATESLVFACESTLNLFSS